MGEKMYETDILVILYPNAREVKSVFILDPFDSKIECHKVDSLEEAKEVLRQNLPFCDQHHEPLLHLGVAYVAESSPQELVILYPSKNELKQVIVLDLYNKKVESYRVDSIDEVKELTKEYQTIEWESIPETEIAIKKPSDIDSLR
jgi:hypothetical protein